jgi:hypothetical protein
MLKNYLKYSGLWVGFIFNPYHWEIKFTLTGPTELDPAMHTMFIAFGPFWIRGVIDNGNW